MDNMIRTCEWCGAKFPAREAFRFCVGCELKAQKINDEVEENLVALRVEWDDEVGEFCDDLVGALEDMFDDLGKISWSRPYLRHLKTIEFVTKALQRKNLTFRYDASFDEMDEKYNELITRLETTIADDQYAKEPSDAKV